MISLPCDSESLSWCSSPPRPFVPGHLTGCCRGFPTFLWLAPLCSVPLVSRSPCHLSHNLCLLCRMLLNIFLHVPSSLLLLPLCLLLSLLPPVSLSAQLAGSCRAFPATRAAGKRPSAAPFDVPSPLILFTWTALRARFLLNRSSPYFLVLCFLCTTFFLSFLSFPCNTDQFKFNLRYYWSSTTNISGFSFSFLISPHETCSIPPAPCMVARSFGLMLHKCHMFLCRRCSYTILPAFFHSKLTSFWGFGKGRSSSLHQWVGDGRLTQKSLFV